MKSRMKNLSKNKSVDTDNNDESTVTSQVSKKIPRGRRAQIREKMKSVLAQNRAKKPQPKGNEQDSMMQPSPFLLPEQIQLRSNTRANQKHSTNENYIINLRKLSTDLERCTNCKKGPLSLTNIIQEPKRQGLGVIIHVSCTSCDTINLIKPYDSHRIGARGPAVVDANTRAGLAMLHAGLGPSHLSSVLSIIGVPPPSIVTIKKREREVGAGIESEAQDSCSRSIQNEKNVVMDSDWRNFIR